MAQKRAVVKKRVEKKPRNSTAQFVRRLNLFVGLYKGTDLRFYVNENDLVKFQVIGAVQTGKIEGQATQDAIRAYGAQPAPALCTWVTDEEQPQLTGGEYAIERLRVYGVRFSDWFHRCWNDMNTAMARAGVLPVWYATAFPYNIGHGQW